MVDILTGKLFVLPELFFIDTNGIFTGCFALAATVNANQPFSSIMGGKQHCR
jgi:hypothetical protein